LAVTDILGQYKNLYQIEHCFRSFKSYLETRPMFHWNSERIKGHLYLCYIAYTLQNHVQLLLQQNKVAHSENHIRKTLDKMQLSLIQKQDELFYLRADLSKEQEQLLAVLKIKVLPNLIPKNDLEKYIHIAK
jgi:transposase